MGATPMTPGPPGVRKRAMHPRRQRCPPAPAETIHINAPVRSLVPDPNGVGYWLVAADGGIFAFDAGFHGSMGGAKLNKPVVGMVAFGNGYLMVGRDGGIFNFSDKAFYGSLGNPPSHPIVSVAVLEAP
jgi:hypothetical protein